ncbi:hypothetical protein F4777DRAFT_572759 [Nemania sp. FL0916]|nr:hypothetical protein F4777DRAFT_572759 [Nemania sp. FL0916]
MFTAIGKQSQPPPADSGKPGAGDPILLEQFIVHITCEDSPECTDPKWGTKSLAITDSKAEIPRRSPSMRFCPLFFRSDERRTKNHLDALPYKKNSKRRDASWCKPDQKFGAFEVAGTTVLHELTHLHAAAVLAGLHNDDGMVEFTEDIYSEEGFYSDPEAAARKLHNSWKQARDGSLPKNRWPPFEEKLNAESYAASATEWWFMSMCDFDSIIGNLS